MRYIKQRKFNNFEINNNKEKKEKKDNDESLQINIDTVFKKKS